MNASALDLILEPLALVGLTEVIEFEADVARVKLSQAFDSFARCFVGESECFARNRGEVFFAQAMKLERELGRSVGRVAEWIYLSCEVAKSPDGLNEGGGTRDFAQE